MKLLIVFLVIFSLYPVMNALSEGRGGGGSSGGGDSRGGEGNSGGGNNYTSNNNFHDSGNYSGGRNSYSGNARSNNFGTRSLGSSYWGSRRQFSLVRNQNNFNHVHGYSFSNRNSSMNGYGRLNVGGNPSRYVASSVVPSHLSSLGVRTMPHSVLNTQMPNVTRNSPKLAYPKVGANGAALHASVVTPRNNSAFVQSRMSTMAGNRSFMGQVNGFNRTENGAGRYYWHNWNGSNYCHYCDFNGCNWYGCYDGGSCFWSCYYGDNWWWYDGGYDRWCYWDNDNWWWQNPYDVNQTYVYNDGNYVSTDETQTAAPANASTSMSLQGVYASADGTRQVKVTGASQDAFLFDKSTPPAFQPVYLASRVKEVSFSKPKNGQSAQIAVVLQDGSFALFDDQGQPVQ